MTANDNDDYNINNNIIVDRNGRCVVMKQFDFIQDKRITEM